MHISCHLPIVEDQPVKCFNAGECLMVQDKNAREILILKKRG